MIIEITQPEVEALINQRLGSGAFKDAEDVVFQALRAFAPEELHIPATTRTRFDARSEPKDMVELFAPVRGFNLTFERDKDPGRPIEL